MSRIKSLYREYFQKSKVFLYPVLDIKRGNSIIPTNTYIVWAEHDIKPKDCKLICVYKHSTDEEFIRFESEKLKGNKLYDSSMHINDGTERAYIFNLMPFRKDWHCVINGTYSKISIPFKRKIKDFYKESGTNYVYIESFLHPEKYFGLYSELLNVPIETLKEVGELCSPVDFDRETLKATILDLIVKKEDNHEHK